MDARILPNLVAISVQVALVIAAGGLCAWALRVRAPGVLYGYLRALLLVSLLLPVAQPWHPPSPPPASGPATSGPGVTPPADPATTELSPSTDALHLSNNSAAALIMAIVAGGVVAHLLRLVVGLARLRRLRRAGLRVSLAPPLDDLPKILGSDAELRSVPSLPQPVTFGVFRPVVLLPASLAALPMEQQRTVIAHELIHVQRLDWPWVLAEECLRAIFWFHPAIRWLISRIQLAREQAVDELTVLATSSRRAYIEALMAFADRPPCAPVTAFARRRHLFSRLALIAKETPMSPKRIVLSCAGLAAAVLVTAWYAASAFPLEAIGEHPEVAAVQGARPGPPPPPPSPPPAPPQVVTGEGQVMPVVRHVTAVYPLEARPFEAHGHVTLGLTIDAAGNVAGLRVRGVSINAMREADADAMRGLTDAFIRAVTDAAQQWQFEPPGETRSAIAGVAIRPPGALPRPPQPAPGPGAPGTWSYPPNALRVGGHIKPPVKTHHVSPVYPAPAEESRVQGIVVVEILIDESGAVAEARVLRSIPLLDQAALDAVREWRFVPTLVNGAPVPVILTITVQFTLANASQPPPRP